MRPLGWALSQYDWCPTKKRKFGDRHTWGEHLVKMKAELGVMAPQAEEHQRLATDQQKLGDKRGPALSSWSPRRSRLCQHLDLRLASTVVRKLTSVL